MSRESKKPPPRFPRAAADMIQPAEINP
jgi:hypothetical protein